MQDLPHQNSLIVAWLPKFAEHSNIRQKLVCENRSFLPMSGSQTPALTDVRVIMRDVRRRIRSEHGEQDWVRQARRTVPGHLTSGVARLRASTSTLRSAIARIGQPPPAPATLRARLGLVVVRLMQRGLFWYTPSIQTPQNQLVDLMEAHLKITEEMLAILERTNVELARMSQSPRQEPSA